MTNKPPRPPGPPNLSQYRPGTNPGAPHAGQRPPRPGVPPQEPIHQFSPNRPQQEQPPHGHVRHPNRPRRRPGSGFGIGTFLLYGLVALVAVVAGVITFLVISPPVDLIRSQAISAVKQQTGRDLKIDGPTSISFFPSIGISMGNVTLGAAPEMGGPPLVKMANLTVAVKLLPLLASEVVVDTLILDKPEFDLRVDAKGRKSWEFAGASSQTDTRALVKLAQATKLSPTHVAQASTSDELTPEAREFLRNATDSKTASRRGGQSSASLDQLRLGDVRIVNGTLSYIDVPQNVSQRIDAINVAVELPSITAPLKTNGDLTWNGDKIDFEATLTSLKKVLGEAPANLDAKISTRRVTAVYDGTIQSGETLSLNGSLNADAKSMRGLVSWLGTKLPKVEGFGPLSIKGRLNAKGATYRMSSATISLDGAAATGDVAVTTGGARPYVEAKLKLSELDLNKYMPQDASAPAKAANKRPKKAKNGTTKPEVRGYAKRDGWSHEAIDFSGLGAVDADAELTVGRLLYQKIKVDQSRVVVKLKDKALNAELSEMSLYNGSGRGRVTLSPTSSDAADLGANFAMESIAVQPLLRDAAEMEWLSGTGQVTLALASSGGNQYQLVNALSGTTKIQFIDGAVKGLNLPSAIRSFGNGDAGSLNQSPTQKTDFSELNATFDIANGIASNNDLTMLSPLLRLTGAGNISLPDRSVDYTVKPKLVADLAGQGGGTGLDGIVIPVRISGPFDNLTYTPDAKGIFENPDQALGVVKKLGEKFKGKKPQEILDGVLGGLSSEDNDSQNGSDATEGEAKKKKFDAKKLLDGLFGN